MPIDHEDFQKTVWPKREWVGYTGEFQNVVIVETTPIPVGQTNTYTIFTVPTGKKLFWTGLIESTEVRFECDNYIEGGITLFKGFKEEFFHFLSTIEPALVFTEGIVIKLDFKNVDIIPGRFSIIYSGWTEPASIPENPKNDDPKERFRVGDYNYCTKYFLPNNEVAIVFFKQKEKIMNYLKLKNHGTPEEKMLNQAKIKLSEGEEIRKVIASNKPEEISKILTKLENKFK